MRATRTNTNEPRTAVIAAAIIALGLLGVTGSRPAWAIVAPTQDATELSTVAPTTTPATSSSSGAVSGTLGRASAPQPPKGPSFTSCSTLPAAPTGLTVSRVLAGNCTLSLAWTAGAVGCSADTLTYNIYRGTALSFTPNAASLIATGVTATSYLDTQNLSAGTTFYYVVRSVDSVSGEEPNVTTASATLPPPPITDTFNESFEPLGSPINTGWTVNVLQQPWGTPTSWAADTTKPHSGAAAVFAVDWPSDGSGHVGGDTAYQSGVIKIDGTSVLSFWHTWSFENQNSNSPPAPPATYACGANCWDGGVLEYKKAGGSWTRVTSFLTGGYNGTIDGAHITDNPLGRDTAAWVGGTIPPRAYIQTSVAIGAIAGAGDVQLRWRMAADTGNAAPGALGWFIDDIQVTNVVLANTCTLFCTAPAAPSVTSATATCAGVDLSLSPGATGSTATYNVYRSTSAAGSYVKINTSPVTGTTYSDNSAVAGTTYFYEVKGACDTGGVYESPMSAAVSGARLTVPSATTLLPFTAIGATSVQVGWTAAAGATSYDVRRTNGGCSGSGATVASSIAGASFTDTGIVPSTTYGYSVIAKNTCGVAPASACASTATQAPPPATPTELRSTNSMRGAKLAGDGSAIRVTWDATCAATDYEIVMGTAQTLPRSLGGTYGVSGVLCSIGRTGTADWNGVPSVSPGGLLWFLVVGHDGVRAEGSWGVDSRGAERSGPGPSGSTGQSLLCTRDAKVTTNTCGR